MMKFISKITLFSILSTIITFSVFESSARGQSIREMANKHVDDSIEKEREKKKAAKEANEKKKRQEAAQAAATKKDPAKPSPQTTPAKTAPQKAEPQKKPESTTVAKFYHDPTEPKPKEKMPKRILHKYLKLDPMAGVAYRGWIPQGYPNVETDIANYFTWTVSLKGRFFNLVSLKKGHYEANGLSSPRHPHKTNAAKYGNLGSKAAFFLAELGIPIMKAWEPVIRYETKAYQTTARTKRGKQVCIVDYNTDADDPTPCVPTESELTVTSSYETAVAGVTYYPSKNPSSVVDDRWGKKPPFFFGVGYLSYVKPYQITLNGDTLNEYLFTGRFYGGGLAFGTELGGGVNHPKLDVWTQFGLAKARLTKDLTLNELAPKDWVIGYLQGNLTFTFPWAPFKFAPTVLIVPSVEASGALFGFIETERNSDEEFVMPLVNWDIVYCAKLSLIVTL